MFYSDHNLLKASPLENNNNSDEFKHKFIRINIYTQMSIKFLKFAALIIL